MLVLTRLIGEKLVIDHTITITVLKISKRTIKLGIEAPLNISVDRLEIYNTKNLKPLS